MESSVSTMWAVRKERERDRERQREKETARERESVRERKRREREREIEVRKCMFLRMCVFESYNTVGLFCRVGGR